MQQLDPFAKEDELTAAAASWDVSHPVSALPGDIPLIDLTAWRTERDFGSESIQALVEQIRNACENIGFFQITGHGLSPNQIDNTMQSAEQFHLETPLEEKLLIHIDDSQETKTSLKGVGYLPLGERRFPRRQVGNRNEAFLIKKVKGYDLRNANQWPRALPAFQDAVIENATAIEAIAKSLVPLYAAALYLKPDFFDEAMAEPFWRLRLTHYPPSQQGHGIAPHVDTSFFTLLLQDSPGLVVHHHQRNEWIRMPFVPGAIVVNTGELLRQWSNDQFLSTRHFADNENDGSRFSVAFFFNAAPDYRMECLPTCCGPDRPAKYQAFSYSESQAVAQGE